MGFKHKKKYGQNFLTNAGQVLDRIIEVSDVNSEDAIVEIGPGEGALTELLLEHGKKVTCMEIDKDLEKILRNKFDTNPKFTLLMGDVLEQDFQEKIGEPIKVVANIPYYITSPIIHKLIQNRNIISEIYIMVQKEVAQRICAKSGSDRSVLTLSVEYFGDAEYLFTIPKEDFTPVPKIDSAFMSIKLRPDNKYEKLVDEATFFKYVKAAFATKRKNILNNLSNLGFTKAELKDRLATIGIEGNRRAESISIDEYMELIRVLEEK
ncbi:MAG: 16S rRNA (adenine(1518)-N(6)/adenine(1519)-N(6))-dimethyltransferase RsmA [Psychrilyobacter sp.]|uniref:16S rRNA (adenine(1518)-N(6)/adenine(1519)-N(6))- dimethyltransferase RsmA n=1 Tax=Psychrilyobacter sp. TaxID=2586924 RepID=UPI003C78F5CD